MTTLEYKPNTYPLKRKTQTVVQGRPLAIALHPSFLEIRRLGSRKPFAITWNKIYEVAARIKADQERSEKRAKNKNRKTSVFR